MMEKLGVHQYLTDEENMEIIRQHYVDNPEHTLKQVRFLCLCWKGEQRKRAEMYLDKMKESKQYGSIS